MSQDFPDLDPFPPSDFDRWADSYDQDVTCDGFPFIGYPRVLAEVVRQAEVQAGMTVLDLGAGTGNLSERFLALGCTLWGTDFSDAMLIRARAKLPAGRFFLHDLRQPFPADLMVPFDRIVSAYVFHHFKLAEKVAIIQRLMHAQLAEHGRLVIADLSFPTRQVLEIFRQAAGDAWEEEPYWVAGEALPALAAAGVGAVYQQVSDCAGVYRMSNPG